MTMIISDNEWNTLTNITEDTLVDMAADLSLLVPKVIDRRSLCAACVEAIVARATTEGLPFSKYDQEDLEALTDDERKAICELQGIKPTGTVRDILKAGQKVYRFYQKNRPDNPTAMMIPALLPCIARYAKEIQTHGKRS